MNKILYILNHIINPAQTHMVGLIKSRGPSFLIGKISVPGGKLELGEDIFEAASRETLEETGLVIEKDKWVLFDTYENEEYVLYKVYTISEDVFLAKKTEEEEIVILEIDPTLEDATVHPERYTPDFLKNYRTLKLAMPRVSW